MIPDELLVGLEEPILVLPSRRMTQAVTLPNRAENTASNTTHYPKWGFYCPRDSSTRSCHGMD